MEHWPLILASIAIAAGIIVALVRSAAGRHDDIGDED